MVGVGHTSDENWVGCQRGHDDKTGNGTRTEGSVRLKGNYSGITPVF
jgi:hypothetical protein